MHVMAEEKALWVQQGYSWGVCFSGEGPDRCTEHKHITGSKSPQGLLNDVSTPGCSEDAASSPHAASMAVGGRGIARLLRAG